ncbi:MAG: hypothetical protein E7037_01660 [Verrucomicrobia bacterium]|nr:hypothetical protein [Verrucomicrobiota bacterium]
MSTDELRILILRIVRVNGAAGTTEACIRAQIRTEDKRISEKRIDESVAYLLDRGFLLARKSKVSATMRLRVAPDGIDFLEEEGF